MKSPRIVQLAMFAMVVFGSVGTAFADIAYSFTTIDAPPRVGNTNTFVYGINNSGQIVGFFVPFLGGAQGFLYKPTQSYRRGYE